MLHNHYEPEKMLVDRKKFFIKTYYSSELLYLSNLFYKNFQGNIYGHECTLSGTENLILEIMANFPVYRIYISNKNDESIIWLFNYIAGLRLKTPEAEALVNILKLPDRNTFYCFKRLQQFLPAVMAKSMEDNLFFRYIPNAGKNEVGCYIFSDNISVEEFHEYNEYKQENYMYGMNTLSTHDTKLGEDLRAKIISIYDDPDGWSNTIAALHKISLKYKSVSGGIEIPSKNEEYYFYQIILAESPEKWNEVFTGRVAS